MNSKTEIEPPQKAPAGRIRGFDAIRFVCAFCVVMYHNTGFGAPHQHISGPLLSRVAQALWNLSFDGAAAVMVFFVISGFAIHYPFRHGETPAWGEYFFRRYIRIGIPAITAVTLLWLAGPLPTALEGAVIWSLYAEAIYYTLYPLLMVGKRRLGWRTLLVLSAGAALLVILHAPRAEGVHDSGVALTWILYLPTWLLGCLLAEHSDALTAARVPRIWLWRITVLAVAALCELLGFHSPIGLPWTMPLFSILVFFWLRQEIRRNRMKPPIALLEKAGAWSYSLYLMHLPAFWLFHLFHVSFRPAQLLTILQLSFVMGVAYIFYLLVERPSHWLARQAKQKNGQEVAPVVPERNQVEQPQPTAERPEADFITTVKAE